MKLNKLILLKLGFLWAIGAFSFSLSAKNDEVFVIPALQEWNGGEGYFELNKGKAIVVDEQYPELESTATIFAEEIKELSGKEFKVKLARAAQKGDLFLTLSNALNKGDEAYRLTIGDQVILQGATSTGVFWATRTLLQLLEQDARQWPKGEALDWPNYPKRGFMLDAGRKYFSIDFLRDYVKFMSYYKMNYFQIHLNDNAFKQFFGQDWDQTPAAFRLESERFPELTSKDGSYTKKEFIDLQKLAEQYHVVILPEIDAPAHSLAFTRYKPEIGSEEYGMDHLDLFNPETYKFMDALFDEYLSGDEPVFRGKEVHIGTDEYSNRDQKVVEQFRHFTDHYIRHVEKYGKKAYVWGALTHAKGETPVKVEDVTMSMWYNGYADPKEMMKQGYDMISIPDGYVYLVPNAGYYYDYLNIEYLYKNWEPNMIGNQTFDKYHPQIKGGMFAVWNDHPFNGVTFKDVHDRVFPAMQTLSMKMWAGKEKSPDYSVFDVKRKLLGDAPGINIQGRVKTHGDVVMECQGEVKQGRETGIEEVGFGYKVSFDLKLDKEPKKGNVLFRSKSSVVYLSDYIEGKLAFYCDGYLNRFNYKVPVGEKVNITISGDNKTTALYVNGVLKEELKRETLQFGKDKMYYLQTLVFPLAKVGCFEGVMSNLKVTKQ